MKNIAITITVAVATGLIFSQIRIPAAWFVGPMVVTLFMAVKGSVDFKIPRFLWIGALAVIGTAISRSFDIHIISAAKQHWVAILIVVIFVLTMSIISGWLLVTFFNFDPVTAYFGVLPGGATSMVALTDEFGGDTRLVAIMQYSRLIVVIFLATVIAYIAQMLDPSSTSSVTHPLIPQHNNIHITDYLLTITLTALGGMIGYWSKIPAGIMLIPLAIGLSAKAFNLFTPSLPPGILEICYIFMGIQVGLRYTRKSVIQVIKALPVIMGFIFILMLICAGIGFLFSIFTQFDLLTSYLATTPGGINSVVIAALETGSNTTVVMTIQMVRLLLIISLGPFCIRFILGQYYQRYPKQKQS